MSELNCGTTFIIELPFVSPSIFVNTLRLGKKESVYIFDDDKFIHEVWRKKLQMLAGAKKNHFFYLKDFVEFLKNQKKSGSVFLIDYKLDHPSYSGLD